MGDAEDFELVLRSQQGDLEAFEALVDKYQQAVFNLALRVSRRYDDAQDIAQSVFLKAFENLPSFKAEHKFFSWIYRIAANEAINFAKRKQTHELIEEVHTSDEPNPEQALVATETGRQIEEAMNLLSPEYRAVIVLRHLDGMSYQEIAQTLGVPEKTVKSRLFSARKLLCETLTQRGVTAND